MLVGHAIERHDHVIFQQHLLGITVRIDALTRLEDKSSADVDPLTISSINAGDYLEVRGSELPADSGDILASIVERDDADTETILQGFVTAVANPSFTILGVTITTNGATQFRDTDDSAISAAEFFSRVAAGTLVKAKGLETSSTTMTADEVEFEQSDSPGARRRPAAPSPTGKTERPRKGPFALCPPGLASVERAVHSRHERGKSCASDYRLMPCCWQH